MHVLLRGDLSQSIRWYTAPMEDSLTLFRQVKRLPQTSRVDQQYFTPNHSHSHASLLKPEQWPTLTTIPRDAQSIPLREEAGGDRRGYAEYTVRAHHSHNTKLLTRTDYEI